MILRIYYWLQDWWAEKPPGGLRSSGWRDFRKTHIKERCSCCGRKGTLLKPLELHHIQSFHEHPERELDPTNVDTFCRRCHQLIAHLDNFKSINVDVLEDARVWRAKLKSRP